VEEQGITVLNESTDKFCYGCMKAKPIHHFPYLRHNENHGWANCCRVCVARVAGRSESLWKVYGIDHFAY
jgi:hypothetical protein